MLTARGYWFVLTTVALLGASVALGAGTAVLICLTLVSWFLVQWFLFLWRGGAVPGRLRLERTLHTSRGTVEALWAGQPFEVRVELSCGHGLSLPFIVMSDRVPAPARWRDGLTQVAGALTADAPLVLHYRLECPGAGRVRFDGVHLQLADLAGFFYTTRFLRAVRSYRVLPGLPKTPVHWTLVKAKNTLPLVGTHHHPQPGTGSELLDLRDYVPGDPPKMIAWKVSARRDRLVIRELESEVPIRCTLFVDLSNSVRVGPVGATALTRLVEIAAGVAQANTAERDLTGLCLFDETGVRRLVRANRGGRHLWQLIDVLADAAALLPAVEQTVLADLLPFGYGLAQDVYPELLDADVNRMPWWLPLWAPQPRWTIPQPPLPVRGGALGWLRRAGLGVGRWLRHYFWLRFPLRTRPLRPNYFRSYRWRKQLAAILSVHYDLGPGGLALLLEDDLACGQRLQQFLAEHQVSQPYPLYDHAGQYLFRAPAKLDVLADALLTAVTHGKDNELFVLLADLLEAGPDLTRLERAICVARARHHQVLVVCPWPRAVPLPRRAGTGVSTLAEPLRTLEDVVLRASTLRLQDAYQRLQQGLARLGVAVVCAAADDTVDVILSRLQRLRVRERGAR